MYLTSYQTAPKRGTMSAAAAGLWRAVCRVIGTVIGGMGAGFERARTDGSLSLNSHHQQKIVRKM